MALPPNHLIYTLDNPSVLKFLPFGKALENLLFAAYLRVTSQVWSGPHNKARALLGRLRHGTAVSRRIFIVCVPFEGENDHHAYAPPFGLGAYDPRFRGIPRPRPLLSLTASVARHNRPFSMSPVDATPPELDLTLVPDSMSRPVRPTAAHHRRELVRGTHAPRACPVAPAKTFTVIFFAESDPNSHPGDHLRRECERNLVGN